MDKKDITAETVHQISIWRQLQTGNRVGLQGRQVMLLYCSGRKAEEAFLALKSNMQSASTLGNPDYSKPFYLYVAERSGYATAVLLQDTPMGKQP